VIGATGRNGGEAAARPMRFGEVYATLFRHLGIDVGFTTFSFWGRRVREYRIELKQ
jgi:hypothetical protein